MTPKQTLRAHIEADHRKELPKTWTMRQLASWHAGVHHRYRTSHVHAGTNLGPNDRPQGWYTGEDVVERV